MKALPPRAAGSDADGRLTPARTPRANPSSGTTFGRLTRVKDAAGTATIATYTYRRDVRDLRLVGSRRGAAMTLVRIDHGAQNHSGAADAKPETQG